jgi:hypothetical protein
VLAPEEAVVAGVEDDGAVEQAAPLQRGQERADLAVEVAERAELIVLDLVVEVVDRGRLQDPLVDRVPGLVGDVALVEVRRGFCSVSGVLESRGSGVAGRCGAIGAK